MVGDEVGVSAIAGYIEELPFGAQAIALVEPRDSANRRDWVTQAQLRTHWLQRGAVNTPEQAVCALKLPAMAEEGSAWAAGEAASMVALGTTRPCEGRRKLAPPDALNGLRRSASSALAVQAARVP